MIAPRSGTAGVGVDSVVDSVFDSVFDVLMPLLCRRPDVFGQGDMQYVGHRAPMSDLVVVLAS
jgi:hypothetical protein